MAPTICEDDMDSYQNNNRILRHRSVISYVGRQENRENQPSNEKDTYNRLGGEFVPYSSDRRNKIKRCRRETRMSYESEDSSDSSSIPSVSTPMSFHNYAKRQKFVDSEDDVISTSSDTNENSVSSSFNEDLKRGNIRVQPLNYLMPLTPFSPVSSTTDAMTMCCRSKMSSPRYNNPFYRQDLMEIAMKTIMLLRKNRSLHARLHQLKLETRAFVDDVMSNPENAKLRQTPNQSNEKTHEHSINVLTIKNQ
ncbi:uncharacterized protein LOC116344621 [Contarinia nasturtii]|uniref:uncharacterized protein LOC116344621 n=1 Tax=Contarinia nasturtii TaxID=265458 RepID=UPI0012D39932|nr:uncharacterized protein LOC116344621 [Contarinia nasturtii]XP_031629099.1 uncharacterized protein LOC116344621 [Contarinia nasturtii]